MSNVWTNLGRACRKVKRIASKSLIINSVDTTAVVGWQRLQLEDDLVVHQKFREMSENDVGVVQLHGPPTCPTSPSAMPTCCDG